MKANTVIRWVASYIRDGKLYMAAPYWQGRFTKATKAEALAECKAVLANPENQNPNSNCARIWGANWAQTLKPRRIRCWAEHFDPIGCTSIIPLPSDALT